MTNIQLAVILTLIAAILIAFLTTMFFRSIEYQESRQDRILAFLAFMGACFLGAAIAFIILGLI